MTQMLITVPDEVEYFFREIIGYENEDFEGELLGSLKMTVDDMLTHFNHFRAAEEAEAALDRRLNVIMAMVRDTAPIGATKEPVQPVSKLQERVLISPELRAQREAPQQ